MLFDTSAWIEFFKGTENSTRVANVLKTEENFTSIVTIAELVIWCLRNNLQDKINTYISNVKQSSQVLELNEAIVFAAGKLNYERKKIIKDWGMLDSFIVSTGLFYNLKILTKDSQFKDLENVELLE